LLVTGHKYSLVLPHIGPWRTHFTVKSAKHKV